MIIGRRTNHEAAIPQRAPYRRAYVLTVRFRAVDVAHDACRVKFFVEPVVEKKVTELPAGPLYWRLENFPTLAQAQGAAGPTSLAAEVAGKVWLFTLAPKDGATPGGTKVVEIGPLPPVSASEYLLRVNRAGGAARRQVADPYTSGVRGVLCAVWQARPEDAPRRGLC